jgi:ribokinase
VSASPRIAVVGHVEFVEFALVEHVPRRGEIVVAREVFADAGGGGGVTAVQLAQLGAAVELFTAVGSDAVGRQAARALREHGVEAHAAVHDRPQTRALAHLADDGERTITVLGPPDGPQRGDDLPWSHLAQTDAVYVTAGDAGAMDAARAARILVATPRALPGLLGAGTPVDALVLSWSDAHEQQLAARLDRAPSLTVRTAGARGGSWEHIDGRTGSWSAAPPPGPPVDAFGCGDGFAAGLTYALGAGLDVERAIAYAARVGAAVLTGRGPYGADLGAVGAPAAG